MHRSPHCRGWHAYVCACLSEIEIFMHYTHSLLQPHFCDLLPGKRKGGRCNGDFRIMVNTQLTRMHMHAAQIPTYVASTAYLSRTTHQSKGGGGGGVMDTLPELLLSMKFMLY